VLTLLFAIALAPDLAASNIAKYEAETFYTYSGRTVTISWCYDGQATAYDLEVVNLVGDYREVSETGLTSQSYEWRVPRAGSYQVRVRAWTADGSVSPWAESDMNGNTSASCGTGQSFLLQSLIAPPASGGGFEQ
jgi:hypothetical protein